MKKLFLYLIFYNIDKTNTFNWRECERLTEQVRKHTCLYDKAEEEYKEWDRTKNAWQTIEIGLEYEEDKNNDFKLNKLKHKKHTQEAPVKGVCRCSVVLILRKKI